MDRHDYVAKLITERDSLAEELAGILTSIQELRQELAFYQDRTFSSLQQKFEDKDTQKGYPKNCGYEFLGGESVMNTPTPIEMPEIEQVSDEAISKLHREKHDLEDEIKTNNHKKTDLELDIRFLKDRDFVSYIQSQPTEYNKQ